MHRGYIKFWRCSFDNRLYFADPFTRWQAWLDLIALANHKEGLLFVRGNEVVVKRGFVGWSEDSLAKRWKWSKGKLRRFKKHLETVNQIVNHKSPVLSQIEIVEYEKYQPDSKTDSKTDGLQTVKQTDTNKNVKNVKNEKHTGDEAFDLFWQAYPKRKNKQQAVKAFRKVSAPIETLVAAINTQKLSVDWQKEGGKYIPHPATWLNAGAWEDEMTVDIPKTKESYLQEYEAMHCNDAKFIAKYSIEILKKIL